MKNIKENIISVCTYIINTEEDNYNSSECKDNHVYELAKWILNNINNIWKE